MENEDRIRQYGRYVDDSFGVWKESKKELEEKVKKMEDKEKGSKLKLEIEEKGKITFLVVKIKRNEVERKVQTEWHQKKEHAGIFCNIKSDVDEGTKRNLVKNLEINNAGKQRIIVEGETMGTIK